MITDIHKDKTCLLKVKAENSNYKSPKS